MTELNENFLNLEKHRLLLEENIDKLQKALQQWKTWDAEYEALKEEVVEVGEATQVNELHRIHRDFEGELLTGKELDEVFATQRTKDQIINLLDRRIDYVSKNIATLEKQLEQDEQKHVAATMLTQPGTVDEEGQPITEIVEELDEDGNVLSYELQKQGDSLPKLEEVFSKAALQHQQNKKRQQQQQQEQQQQKSEVKKEKQQVLEEEPPAQAKSVAFAEDTKPGDEPAPEQERSQAAKRVDKIMKSARQQKITDPIIPEEEDEEDAFLRQEMLKYSMGEVGAVVAELDIEEDDEGYGDEEEDDVDLEELYEDEYDEDMDNEDKWGRYTGQMVTDDYRERMLELEKKLGISSGRPDKQTTQEGESTADEERVGRIVVKAADSNTSNTTKEPKAETIKGKKGVRFAEELDIAPETDKKEDEDEKVDPVSDLIVERKAPTKANAPATQSKPARTSRFKQAREGGIPKGPMDVPSSFLPEEDNETKSVPSGPAGRTISDRLVEKDTVSKPTAPDEYDESMIHFEVADEHQRMRRKFIQQQGGFLAEDESPIQPLDNEAAEPVSRFKAARLSRQ